MDFLKYIAAAAATALLTGCHQEFIPKNTPAPVLCLNALVVADEPVENLVVSRTALYTEDVRAHELNLGDCTFEILADGQLQERNYIPHPGDRLTLRATHQTYGTVCADVEVPRPADIAAMRCIPEITDIAEYPDDNFATVRFNLNIELDITDIAGQADYFNFSWISWSPEVTGSVSPVWGTYFQHGTFNYKADPIYGEHITAFDAVISSAEPGDFNFFTDTMFRDGKYTLHMQIRDNVFWYYPEVGDCIFDCGITLWLNTVSQSFYNWGMFAWQFDYGIFNDLADLGLGDPMATYSNTSTGAGVVAARTPTALKIDLAAFLKQAVADIQN